MQETGFEGCVLAGTSIRGTEIEYTQVVKLAYSFVGRVCYEAFACCRDGGGQFGEEVCQGLDGVVEG
jgi:hypothetical protein